MRGVAQPADPDAAGRMDGEARSGKVGSRLVPEVVVIALLVALVIVGAAVGLLLVVRTARGDRPAALEANPMAPRVTCEVRAGEEQVLIHLARSLALPAGKDDVGYGEVYLAGSAGTTMKLATRSEIGRGFDGEIRVHRTRRSSVAEYFVLRLPGDEAVLQRIATLDERIVSAARSLDPQAAVHRDGDPRDHRRGPLGRMTASAG